MAQRRKFHTVGIDILLLITCLILVVGCRNNSKTLVYRTESSGFAENGVNIKASLTADVESGMVNLILKVQNRSKEKIKVDYPGCSLYIENERGAAPQAIGPCKNELLPGETEKYEFLYRPVNSVSYYKMLEYRGDVKQKYSIQTDFLKDFKDNALSKRSIVFELDNKVYLNYLRLYGKENKIQLFNFGFNVDTFTSVQKAYLQTEESYSPSGDLFVSVSNPGIIMGRRVINFQSYKQNDTLTTSFTILNNGPDNLIAKLDSIRIKVANHVYLPQKITSEYFNYNNIVNQSVVVDKGARFNIIAKYNVPEKFSEYELNTSWLLLKQKDKSSNRLIFQNLTLKSSQSGQ